MLWACLRNVSLGWLKRFALSATVVGGGILFAEQFDAPYYKLREGNENRWASEDAQVNSKLKRLEARFGKKPNIIYILADDVGWREMGWQGGGKHRGTPHDAEVAPRFIYGEESSTVSRSIDRYSNAK